MNNLLTTTPKTVRLSASGDELRTPRGTPYRNVRTAFEGAVCKAQIHGLTFHDPRHTLASRLVMAGLDLATVQALLGHKTIALTLRYT